MRMEIESKFLLATCVVIPECAEEKVIEQSFAPCKLLVTYDDSTATSVLSLHHPDDPTHFTVRVDGSRLPTFLRKFTGKVEHEFFGVSSLILYQEGNPVNPRLDGYIRIRRTWKNEGWWKYELTIKCKVPNDDSSRLVREEYNYPMPDVSFPLYRNVVAKRRFVFTLSGVTYEVDVFESFNKGLCLIEVEDPNCAPNYPSWVGRNVSGDPRFENSYLAHFPFKQWAGYGAGRVWVEIGKEGQRFDIDFVTPERKTICIVMDCDGTLLPGNMQEYGLLETLGHPEPNKFWAHCSEIEDAEKLSKIEAYLTAISRKIPPTMTFFEACKTNKIKFHNGVERFFGLIHDICGSHFVHFAFVTCGMEELITPAVSELMRGLSYSIHACQMHEMFPNRIRTVLTANDKPKVIDSLPGDPAQRGIIYLGDSGSDVPAMKRVLRDPSGYAIVVAENHAAYDYDMDEFMDLFADHPRVFRASIDFDSVYSVVADLIDDIIYHP